MRYGFGLQEESVKLLGVLIDKDLNWEIHINNVLKKLLKLTTYYGDTGKNLILQLKK